MGIDARLVTEKGEALEALDDPQNRLSWFVLNRASVYSLLRFIDPYGDTKFNDPPP